MTQYNTAIELIKAFEGFRGEPYKCPAGVPTIGYGTTIYPDGRKVSMRDDDVTEAEATEYLEFRVKEIWTAIHARTASLNLNNNQMSALVSWVYNFSINRFTESTMYKLLRQKEYKKAMDSLQLWINANGKPLEGLKRRRKAEADLFLKKE